MNKEESNTCPDNESLNSLEDGGVLNVEEEGEEEGWLFSENRKKEIKGHSKRWAKAMKTFEVGLILRYPCLVFMV